MKTKIVEHIAGNAWLAIREADSVAAELRAKHPGLDLSVLREKLAAALKLVELLTT